MNVSPKQEQVYEEIRREHEALRAKLKNIQDLLAAAEVDRHEVASMLTDLHGALAAHFENEERETGLFEEITAQAPRLGPRASQLCGEHGEMLRTTRALAQFAAHGAASEVWRRELRRRFELLARQLRHHEGQENALLQQAYQEDIGSHD